MFKPRQCMFSDKDLKSKLPSVIVFESTETGSTGIFISCLDSGNEPADFVLAGTLPCNASGLGGVAISDQKVVLAFSALATPTGQIYDASQVPCSWSPGREYTRMPVRTGEAWITSETLAVFCTILTLSGQPHLGDLFNVLHGPTRSTSPTVECISLNTVSPW